MQPGAYVVVRTIVPNPADRDEFDRWYREDHIPEVIRAMGPRRIIRAWNRLDPAEHTAFYGFPSAEAAAQVTGSKETLNLIAEFDHKWDGRTTRSRAILQIVQDEGG